MASAPSQSQDKFIIRMPGDLRDRIKRAADRAGRSMNAEITSVLGRAYPPESVEMTLREIDELIEWVQNVRSIEDFDARLHEANARLIPAGGLLEVHSSKDGRMILGLVSQKSMPGLFDFADVTAPSNIEHNHGKAGAKADR